MYWRKYWTRYVRKREVKGGGKNPTITNIFIHKKRERLSSGALGLNTLCKACAKKVCTGYKD